MQARTLRAFLALALSSFAALPAQVDYRSAQSPVKHQGARGTCAAFAICAALETLPGTPTDLSEQLLYATLKLHQSGVDAWLTALGEDPVMSAGDALMSYAKLFELFGTCHERYLPYDPNPRAVANDTPADVKRYLELAQIPGDVLEQVRLEVGKYGMRASDVEVLKPGFVRMPRFIQKWLDEGVLAVPVTYLVHPREWSRLQEVGMTIGDGKRTVIHPGMMDRFARSAEGPWLDYVQASIESMQKGEDLPLAVFTGAWKRQPIDPVADNYGGHAVTIVGYTDRGFLIKNSWGTSWGDQGYALISYDYHKLYANHAIAIRRPRIRHPALSPFEQTARLRESSYFLKVQPIATAKGSKLVFSTWMLDRRDPDAEVVSYALERETQAGQWSSVTKAIFRNEPLGDRIGVPFEVARDVLEPADANGARLRVVVRYGLLPLDPQAGLDQARFLATRVFGPFPAMLATTLDLPGRTL